MLIKDLENLGPNSYYYQSKDQLKRHVYGRSERAFAAGDAARDALKTANDVKERQKWIRAAFIDSLGGLPPSDTPLNVRTVDTIACDGFRIEKIIYESRPRNYVTANLYVPDGITAPRGAVLFVCGHHEQAKHVPEYQIVCRYLVKTGLVVLAQDPIGQGERMSYYEKSIGATTVNWGCPEHDYAGGQCLPVGDAIARYFVHDAMRGIDYLLTRPEVDPNRIGVTGNSGGGTQSSLMMVCEPRLAAAVPTTFIMNRQTYMYVDGAQDAEQIWPGMSALGFDHEDILLMMAPKPVRVLAVSYDFFPIEGTRRTVERSKRIWEVCGKPGIVDLVEDPYTHAYTRTLARASAEFFSQHLLGEKVTPKDEEIEPIEPSRLWCTPSGQVRADIPNPRAVFEENLDRLAAVEDSREALPEAERKETALNWLREKVFFDRKPCDLNPRHYATEQTENLTVQASFWWAQEAMMNCALTFRDIRFTGEELPVSIAVWDGGTNCLQPHMRWIRETCSSGRAVMVLDTSGVGDLEPHPAGQIDIHEFYGMIHKLNDDLIWLGDSIAALRTYDVTRALDMAQEWPGLKGDDIRLYAYGRQGVYAQLAAAIDARVADIQVVEGMGSYADWVSSRHYDSRDIRSIVFPGILKYFDLPDLARWRSERPDELGEIALSKA